MRNAASAPGLLEDPHSLRTRFEEAVPFRHIVFEQFFSEELLARLIDDFPPFERGQSRNELGAEGGKAHCPDVREISPAFREVDGIVRSAEFLSWLSAATGIPKLLDDPDYIGGGTHENRSGQDLDPHVDFNRHPTRGWWRRLNLIVFLNPEWKPQWGGALDLHSDPRSPDIDRVARVQPIANRAVLFETTESSWHGFRAVAAPPRVSRRSFAVYYYTADEPSEAGAPKPSAIPNHSTIYVQRGLPERFTAGRRLTEDDVREVQTLLTRRDAQIQMLYEREQQMQGDFDTALRNVQESSSFRLGRAMTWPLRALRRVVRGL